MTLTTKCFRAPGGFNEGVGANCRKLLKFQAWLWRCSHCWGNQAMVTQEALGGHAEHRVAFVGRLWGQCQIVGLSLAFRGRISEVQGRGASVSAGCSVPPTASFEIPQPRASGLKEALPTMALPCGKGAGILAYGGQPHSSWILWPTEAPQPHSCSSFKPFLTPEPEPISCVSLCLEPPLLLHCQKVNLFDSVFGTLP